MSLSTFLMRLDGAEHFTESNNERNIGEKQGHPLNLGFDSRPCGKAVAL
jgi:hypothetical protein